MKQLILSIILFLLASFPAMGQESIYLPLLLKGETVAPEPILRVITQDGKIVDLLDDWEISDPYWRPQIAKYKGDGNYVDSAIADGSRLVSKNYANVVESIPLTVRGTNQSQAIKRIRELLQVIRQAADYWTEPYEYDYAWLEVRPACNDCRTGYARIVKANIPELNNPYGQPFFSATNEAVMDDLTLIIEREPLWRGVQPGTIIGPLYNVAKNPDFELWNFGVTDSQPDSWNDLESAGITGTNSREDDSHSGEYSLKVRVSQSTATNRFKGVSQVIASTRANTEYTVVVWVRNSGVSNGVGRVLVTYSSQLEVYRSSSVHGWQLYTGTFTTGASDTVAINLEILTTAANTDGTVYFDSLMVLEGDWEREAIDEFLPYLSGSHIVNHWDQPENNPVEAGDINYLDVWEVPGDEDALTRLEVQNNTTVSDFTNPVELFARVRIGMRRTKDIFLFDNYHDPVGFTDTTASSNDRVESGNLNSSWVDITSKIVTADTLHNQGRFRVLARVYDNKASGDPNLLMRLQYYIGTANIGLKILDPITSPVRQQWFMANLTPNASMVQDTKFATDVPSQLGYEVQMSRPTGTDRGYLDYVLAMPTDGGFLDATLDPPLTKGNALIVDNTASQSVSATQLRAGWQELFRTNQRVDAIREFRGDVYFGSTFHIFRYSAGQWADMIPISLGLGDIFAFEEYNGELYAATGGTFNLLKSRDGAIWSSVALADTSIFKLISFNGKLFVAGTNGANLGRIYSWNGTSLTTMHTVVGPTAVGGFGVYNGQLYLSFEVTGTSQTIICRYNPATGSWTNITTLSDVLRSDFITFNDNLYAVGGVAAGGVVYKFDGTTFTKVATITGVTRFSNLALYNDALYAGGTSAFYTSTDGTTWTVTYDTFVKTSQSIGVANGVLYAGTTLSNSGAILALSDGDTFYKVANYQGTPFTSPPEKRHRFFFNYDREGYINNADDAALVGIGFVPRFLSLIGAR